MPPTTVEPADTQTRAAVDVQRVHGRSAVTRQRSSSVLKLLCLRQHDVPIVYTSTYGGGLVAGDRVELDVTVGDDALAALTTQASTKVYHQQDGAGATQVLRTTVASGGLFVVMPDPIACFTDAIYEQRQTFDLAPDAALVLLDWFTCGRLAHGERWAFERYASRNVVNVAGRTIINDGLLLDRRDGAIDQPHRAGACHCLATVYLVGDRLRRVGDALTEAVGQLPMKRGAHTIVAASRFDWGVALRVGGESTERVGRLLAEHLSFLEHELGVMPWQRKW